MSYDPANVFAKILRGEMPCTKVYEDGDILAFMDIMPRADGHVLVIPKTPSRNLLDADPTDLAAAIVGCQRIARALKAVMKADGITLQQFSESAGGQVVFHTHFHVIPRFEGESLRPHTGQMADPGTLEAYAQKIRAELAVP